MSQRFANRKLLVSVFNAQEAREAVLGGGRIIDSEDPKSALGNIKPQQIMAISDAVLDFHRDFEVQLSTNIGEDQLLFDRSPSGQAIEKSPYEIAGKAAQAAIGVACSMGTRVHPVNIVKVGLDAMKPDLLTEVLAEVVLTLNRTEQFSHSQVMSVLFAQDLVTWRQRKDMDAVRRSLVELREFAPCDPKEPGAFDLCQYAVKTLKDREGRPLFRDQSEVSLGALIQRQVLPENSDHSYVKVNDPFAHAEFFPGLADAKTEKTNVEVIRAMVDATAAARAHGIMIDSSILSKTSQICCVDTSSPSMVDLNRFDVRDGMPKVGILSLDDIRFFVDYCHYRGVFANLAGSITSYQAQQLWVLVPELDQLSTRGEGSALSADPAERGAVAADTRQHRVIKRHMVRGLAPPEHGGVLNLPESMKNKPEASKAIEELRRMIQQRREPMGLPKLESFFVDRFGRPEPIS